MIYSASITTTPARKAADQPQRVIYWEAVWWQGALLLAVRRLYLQAPGFVYVCDRVGVGRALGGPA